jgi:L-2-hydroxyglutarate oxidase LhgO
VERDADVAVIGGGVVGLAAAAALARSGKSVWLLERLEGYGRETTSRNSEVVHAGIYYPKDSLKAKFCVAGRRLLYERCARLGIPHRKLGKWIVACEDAELPRLEELKAKGEANGVEGLRLAEAAELARAEPHVRAVAGLESPETGIVDSHALCLSLAAEAESHEGVLVLRTELRGIERVGSGYRIETQGEGGERSDFVVAAVVNAAGLESDRVAELAGLDVDALGYRLRPCKGDYFALAPSAPIGVSRLVYPVPSGPGLGVHATLDLGGRIRFGPDAEFVDTPRYDVDPGKATEFAEAITRYLPAMRAEWLDPDYAGVRPRLAGPGEAPRDFVVQEETEAGLPGFVNLIGIESPGLTASLAIGEHTAVLLASL